MITFLKGRLVQSLPNRATVDVHGVGYEVLIPLSTYDRLPATGADVEILTHLHIREQEHTLFGFASAEERDLFRLLINRVSGIGPKLGLAVLSGMGVAQFKQTVVNGDVAGISKIKGVGKKGAERIVLELKDKVGVAEAWEAAAGPAATGDQAEQNDAVLALISLGYKQTEAHKAVNKLVKDGDCSDALTADNLVRAALRSLN